MSPVLKPKLAIVMMVTKILLMAVINAKLLLDGFAEIKKTTLTAQYQEAFLFVVMAVEMLNLILK